MHKLLLILSALCAACSSPDVRLCSDSVVPVAQGSIVGRGGEFSGRASFGELGVEDVEKAGAAPRIEIRSETGTFSFGYMPATYAGEGTLADDLRFGGENFLQDSGVYTEMGAGFMTARWTQDLVRSEPVTVSVGVGFCGLGLKMRVQELGGTGQGEFNELIPLPMAVARLRGNFGGLDFEASYGLHETSDGGNDRRLQDLDARLSLDLGDASGALVLGYRAVQLDGLYKGGGEYTELDATFGGPYLGLTLGF